MGKLIQKLEDAGEEVSPEVLVRVSPLAQTHIIPHGTCHFDYLKPSLK